MKVCLICSSLHIAELMRMSNAENAKDVLHTSMASKQETPLKIVLSVCVM